MDRLGESVFPGETGVLEEPATPKTEIPPGKIEIPPIKITTPRVAPPTESEGTGPPPEPLPACPEGQVLDEISGLCVPEEPVAEEPQAEDEELQQESSQAQESEQSEPEEPEQQQSSEEGDGSSEDNSNN